MTKPQNAFETTKSTFDDHAPKSVILMSPFEQSMQFAGLKSCAYMRRKRRSIVG